MIVLSKFAKRNPIKARFIITLAHIILPFIAIYFGGLLYDIGWGLPIILIPILAIIFFFAFYFYPNKKRQNSFFKHSYRRQKTFDFTFVTVSFFLIATSVNNVFINSPGSYTNTAKAEFIVMKSQKAPSKENTFTKPFKKIKEVRKNIRKEIKAWKKNSQPLKDKGLIVEKIFLIILTLAVAFGLGMLVAALGCELSCSGYTAMAALVYITGFLGIGIGLFFAIRGILRMGNKIETP